MVVGASAFLGSSPTLRIIGWSAAIASLALLIVHESPPPRVTMRFEEFVAWTDAAGFGAGTRSPRYVDWTRIIVWTTLVVTLVGGAIVYANWI